MKIYYFELYGTGCGLCTNKNTLIKEQGTANVKNVELATKQQIDWVRAMGGYVPGEKSC